MSNHPSRTVAAEARLRVSAVFRTGSHETTYGFRVTHPADGGMDRICCIGTRAEASEARREAVREMISALRAAQSK